MMAIDAPAPSLRLKLDRQALAANWRRLDQLSGRARAGAAIKANGYGLGARVVVPVLAAAGARDFFVAHWREAAEVADLVDPASLAVLHGPLAAEDIAFARATGIRPVINSLPQARRWLEAGGGPCHLMVDTGMSRLGLAMGELSDEAVGQLAIEVLHSHLASAEEDVPLNVLQRQRWEEARRLLNPPRAALANSAGIMLGEGWHGDLTRPGLALYGGVPCAALAPHIGQVAVPQVALLQARDIGAGDGVGYNTTFTATRAMRIGTVTLGYADGYLRGWSQKGMLRWQGLPLPVLGRISMDLTIVDLAAAPHLSEGEWLDVDYALPQAAEISGCSQYELLTLLGRRFRRS